MSHKLALALALGLMSSAAFAQTTTVPASNPNLGDQVVPHRQTESAAKLARTDKQPPGTQNGNQPDRAQAMSGAR